jgi:hypothetical protein
MRRIAFLGALLLAFGAAGAAAQAPPSPRGTAATLADVMCAGMVTTEAIPYDSYVISGEESDPKTVFAKYDYLYINKGASQGVKVGDEFLLSRPVNDPSRYKWFRDEPGLFRTMGQQWQDLGRIRVVVVHPSVSIAQVTYACDYIQRGDYVRPATEYPAPAFKPAKEFDRFAPPSGKPQGRVVRAKDFYGQQAQSSIVYINLASKDGAKPGDYVRFFRHPGRRDESVYQVGGMQEHIFGFGKSPQYYGENDLPREILGEGVVLRATPSAATVLIFNSLREIYLGDYAELE